MNNKEKIIKSAVAAFLYLCASDAVIGASSEPQTTAIEITVNKFHTVLDNSLIVD